MIPVAWMPTSRPGEGARPYDRYLFGDSLAVGGPARRCPTLDDLVARAAEMRSRAVDPALLDALDRHARELGAPATTHATISGLRQGDTVLVFAGQQPALAAGPLYTLHKAATAVAAARSLRERGVLARPAFWIPGDDADLHEAGTAFAPGPDRGLSKHTLDLRGLPDGTLVGDLPAAASRAALDALFPHPSPEMAALTDELLAGDADLGTFLARLLLRLFGEEGLVVVDGRWDAVRRAAVPLLSRYHEVRDEVTRAVDAAGDRLESLGVGRAVHPASAAAPLFVLEGGRRRKLEAGEWPHDPATLSPGVVLRSFVQETIFPTAAMVVGPGELAYLLQTESVAEILGVTRSPFLPRLDATWLDATLRGLAAPPEGADEPRWEPLFADPAGLVESQLRARLDPDARAILARLDHDLAAHVDDLVAATDDRGFAQFAGAALNKMRFQLQRLEEQLLDRIRRRSKQDGEVLVNVGDVVRPRQGPQDRTLSSIWPISVIGLHATGDRLVSAAEGHLARLLAGQPAHAILSLDPPGPEPLQGPDKEAPWSASYGSA